MIKVYRITGFVAVSEETTPEQIEGELLSSKFTTILEIQEINAQFEGLIEAGKEK